MNGICRRLAMTAAALTVIAGTSNAKPLPLDLQPSPSAPKARGRATLTALKKATDARFQVKVRRLSPSKDFDLLVAGIKVATVHTTPGCPSAISA